MKSYLFKIIAGLFVISTILGACGSPDKPAPSSTDAAKEQYQCPMKCTEEIFSKPGECPVCKMELEKITKS